MLSHHFLAWHVTNHGCPAKVFGCRSVTKGAQDCMEGQLSPDHFLAVVVLASAWGTVPHTTPVNAASACGTAPSTTAPPSTAPIGRRAASLQVLILQLYPASGLVDTAATNQRACSLSPTKTHQNPFSTCAFPHFQGFPRGPA